MHSKTTPTFKTTLKLGGQRIYKDNIQFYKLTWEVKQQLMELFGCETVEEAADMFDSDPVRHLHQLELIEQERDKDILHKKGVFLSRYEGEWTNGYY